MKSGPDEAAESVARIRQLLADWLRSSEESRQPVAEILTLLESVDSFIRGELGRRSGESKPERDGARSRGGTTYTVEKKKNEVETLTEHREGGSSQPYRVPKYIYDATVNVLAEAKTPLDFEEVVKGVAVDLPEPPEWQVRAVLRFLLNAAPPLVVRERNKYRPLAAKKIAAAAKSAWNTLAKAPK